MSLRSCLFTRKVYFTTGQEAGTIRVEFIPKIPEKRVPLREIKKEPTSRAVQELECMESFSDSEESVSDTEEF